jgi:FAD/FMN-containing dehydrogenase
MSPRQSVVSPPPRSTATGPSRRSCLKLGIGGAALSLYPLRTLNAQPFGATSWLDGDYLVDDASRIAVATDYGGAARRIPRATVRARTAEDIGRVVAYANGRRIKIAMRGQGHSLSGQTLIDDGIVIESTALNSIKYTSDDTLDVEAGALWGDVAKAGLARGRLPPVMPDAMMLSVGGTLSVGGSGETGFRFGAQVDHVRALDVVTGAGRVVSCSATHEPELFHMVLAGMGQCGIIVRARLALAPAAKFVVTHALTYTDLDAFLADQAWLADHAAPDLLNGRLIKTPQGTWNYVLTAGRVVSSADEAGETPDWIGSLHHASAAAPVATPIWTYLDRRTASIMAGKAKAMPNPSLVLTLPAAATTSFIIELLTSPALAIGIWFFEMSPKIPARHGEPLQKMPESALAYELRMQRRASALDAADHRAMLAANAALVATAMQRGGKVYPPFAPVLTAGQWREHYGAATWARFAAGKERFDPNVVLNPGAGIF